MLAEQVEDRRDSKILNGYTLDDISKESLHIYRNLLKGEKPSHPFLELNDLEFLRSIGGWRKSREDTEEGLTVAGLLMFGKGEVIQECLPNYFLDYRERTEAKAVERWMDRIVPDGTWSGNLFDFYRKVYRKLISELKIPFTLKDGQRKDDTPVHEALREALTNTLVHADYFGTVPILIIRRPGAFVFRNPGRMRVPLEQALVGGESDCRNPLMQQMFLLVGVGERAGSGIPRIFQGWKSQHWRRPVIVDNVESEQTYLLLQTIDLLPESKLTELRHKFGAFFDTLSEVERTILVTASIEGVVTHQRIVELLETHPRDLTVTFQNLVRNGVLQSDGRSRGTVYFLSGQKYITPEQVFLDFPLTSSEGLPLSSEGLPLSSKGLPLSSEGFVNNFDSAIVHSGRKIEGLDRPIIDNLNQLPEKTRAELEEAAKAVALQRKCSKAQIKETIEVLCAHGYFTLNLLAHVLERSSGYLRQEILNPMVKEGKLRRAFPTKPNDPRQAYTSAR